jgi:hypothetical protein
LFPNNPTIILCLFVRVLNLTVALMAAPVRIEDSDDDVPLFPRIEDSDDDVPLFPATAPLLLQQVPVIPADEATFAAPSVIPPVPEMEIEAAPEMEDEAPEMEDEADNEFRDIDEQGIECDDPMTTANPCTMHIISRRAKKYANFSCSLNFQLTIN